MSVLKAGEIVKTVRPLEDLAERLPSSKMDELQKINEAGQKKDFVAQLKLLDNLRKDITGELLDNLGQDISGAKMAPKNGLESQNNLQCALATINLMRGNAQERIKGADTSPTADVSQNASTIPPAIEDRIKQVKDICIVGKLTGPQHEQVGTFLSRVEMCSKRGVFDMIPKFAEQFSKEMRESNKETPNPTFGRLAICGDQMGDLAKDLGQKIKAGVNITARESIRNDTVEGPAYDVRSTTGKFLMEKLKGSEPEKKLTLGLGLN